VTERSLLLAATTLGAFALVGVGLVSATFEATRDRIAENERLSLLRKLQVVVPAALTDNDLAGDRLQVQRPDLLGAASTTIYRGRKDGKPAALVVASTVPNGYAAPIQLLVGVRADGVLTGVRVVAHKETPGLGDKIEEEKSDWILGFSGKSLGDPPLDKWGVKRDGGLFDQFAGATVTPRAIVATLKNTLIFVRDQGAALYEPAPQSSQVAGGSS